MEQIVLHIKDKSKLAFIRELLEAFDYIEVLELSNLSAEEQEWLSQMEEAVKEIKDNKQGDKNLRSAKALLDDL